MYASIGPTAPPLPARRHGLIAKAIHHYEDLLRAPLILRWPGRAPAGEVSDAIQNLVGLAPSTLSAAGLKVPGTMAGVDQTPTWTGGPPARTGSITENRHTATNFHMRTYVNQRYKIMVYRKWGDGELFDLQKDPAETHGLWNDPAAESLKCNLLHEFIPATLACEPTRMPRIAGA